MENNEVLTENQILSNINKTINMDETRIKQLKEKLEGIFISFFANFMKFVEIKQYDLEKDKSIIMKLADFDELYITYMLLDIYTQLLNDKDDVSLEHKIMAISMNYFYFEQKIDIRRVVLLMLKESSKMIKTDKKYEHEYNNMAENFYNSMILKKAN